MDEALIAPVEHAAKGGLLKSERFIRVAIQRDLAGRESEVEQAEERIAASLDRLSREIKTIKLAQQALFAFMGSLVKALLTCVAEPPSDAYDQAVALVALEIRQIIFQFAALALDAKATPEKGRCGSGGARDRPPPPLSFAIVRNVRKFLY